MRKLAIVLICIAMLSGCSKKETVDFTKESTVKESINFDREEATLLVEKIEAPINNLKAKEVLTEEEYNALEEELDALYPKQYAEDILNYYISNMAADYMSVPEEMNYPTLKDDGVEIVQVFVERKEYDAFGVEGPPPMPKDDKNIKKMTVPENKGPENKESLIIEEGYSGDNEALKDFKRIYKFRKSKDDVWKLESIEASPK